jgi:RNA polymerase sigma factor (sigma-70 family)
MMWEDTMGFDVSKVRDEARAMDPDVASIDRRIQDAAASMVGVNADRVRRLTGFSDTQGRRGIADVLAPTKPLMGLDSPFLRSAAGIPASGTLLGAVRPDGIYGRIKSAFADDSLCKPVTKFGSLAVVENRASAALNASTVRSVAHSFRNLRPLEESTRRWPSMYNSALGNAGFQQVSAMQQTLAGQYAGHFTQVNKFLDVQSAHIGTQAVQGFVRAYEPQLGPMLDAFTSPLSEVIRKNAAGFAMLAPQRIGEWIKRVLRPFGKKIIEWLHREIERWLRDPYGNFVPFWNVWLYRLAQAAYEGDPVAQARFLNEIEGDDFLDNVSLVDELLRPTFDPERPDRRKDWWLMELADARLWLRKRLRDIRIKKDSERKAAERIYAQRERDELLQVQGKHIVRATARDMLDFDPDLIEFERRERETLLRKRIREMLPEILSERQLQIFEFLTHGMTLKEIAHHLGLSEFTVKGHAMRMRAKLREKPELLDVLRLNGTLG